MVYDAADFDMRVTKFVDDILSPSNYGINKTFDTILLPLIQPILATRLKYGKHLTAGFNVIVTLGNLKSLSLIVQKVCDELEKKLIYADFIENKSFTCEESKLLMSELRNRSNQHDMHESEALARFSEIIKCVSDMITDQILRVMNWHLIKPLSTHAVNSIVDELSTRMQDYCLVDKMRNSDSQNADQAKYDELIAKSSLTDEESKFVNWYGKRRTIIEQISGNAKDYCIAHQQLEIVKQVNNGANSSIRKPSNDQTKYAGEVTANKPAGLAEMLILTKMNGINLKLVDDENYVRTQDDISKNVQVVYVESKKGEQVGHLVDQAISCSFLNSSGEFVKVSSDTSNDCLYGAISMILSEKGVNKTIKTLRAETSDHIMYNPNFTQVIKAEQWIRRSNTHVPIKLSFQEYQKYANNQRAILLPGNESDNPNQIETLNIFQTFFGNMKNTIINKAFTFVISKSLFFIKYCLLFVFLIFVFLLIASRNSLINFLLSIIYFFVLLFSVFFLIRRQF